MPNFSVVMTLYNKVSFVVDAVRSVLAQEFQDLELILVDDGSTDGGGESLVGLHDPRLRVFRQPNAGVSVARNRGIMHASGNYITFLDADDLWSAQHLVRLAELINQDPFAIAWATGYSEFDHTSGTLATTGRAAGSAAAASGVYDQHDFLMTWADTPFFWTGSIAIRASTLRALQPCFPVGERLGEDQDLWFRLTELGPIRYSNITRTAFYRRGVGNSLTAPDVLAPLPAMLRLLERNRMSSPRLRNAVRYLVGLHMLHVAWANCLAGQRVAALRFLWQADPRIRPTYWLRTLTGLMLPNRLVRATLTWIKPNGTRTLHEL